MNSGVEPVSRSARGARTNERRGATQTSSSRASLAGDAIGGLSGAVAALGILLPLGLLAFASLGPDGAAQGVRAAFVAAIVGELAALVVGGVPIPGTLPRTSTTLIFAAFVAGLAADPSLRDAQGGTGVILTLGALCVALAGAMQVLFGLLKLGSAAKFVPLPVVGGFMNGVAILIVVAQVPPLLGLHGSHWMAAPLETLRQVQPWTLAVGATTVALGLWIGRRWPRSPVLLIALVARQRPSRSGAAVVPRCHDRTAARPLSRNVAAAGRPRPPRHGGPHASPCARACRGWWRHRSSSPSSARWTRCSPAWQPTTRSASGTIRTDCSSGRVRPTSRRPRSAVCPPRTASRSRRRSIAPAADCREAGLVAIVVLLAVLMLGHAVLALLPLTVSAAIMFVVATGLFDRWSRGVFRQLKAGSRDSDAVWSLAVVAAVCVITVAFGFVVSVAAGILLSMVLLVVSMNRSLVRSVATGATRASRRVYSTEQAQLLRERGDVVKVLGLEGAIFFGTAETLRRQVERIAPGARFVILDLRRVTTIDASGAVMLERLAEHLAEAGVKLILASIVPGDRRAKALRAFGTVMRDVRDQWFVDADHALEYAERQLLDAEGVAPPSVELPVDRLSLLDGLTAEQREALTRWLERRELAAGEVLFEEGAPGDCMYLLAKGSISIQTGLAGSGGPMRRLVSFAPGVIFGETAMLDGGGRTARAVADEPSVVHVLTRASLEEIRRDDPVLAGQVLFNLARHLSSLLRLANATLRGTDD